MKNYFLAAIIGIVVLLLLVQVSWAWTYSLSGSKVCNATTGNYDITWATNNTTNVTEDFTVTSSNRAVVSVGDVVTKGTTRNFTENLPGTTSVPVTLNIAGGWPSDLGPHQNEATVTLEGTCLPPNPTPTPTPTCTPTPTPTVTPTVTPTPTPRPYHYACDSDKVCSKVEGAGENSCNTSDDCIQEVTPTPTPTPEVTPTPSNPGGPGDNKSDNLGCSVNDCSNHPSAQPQVLGASTKAVLGLSTTSGEENYLLQVILATGALVSGGLGFIFFKKNG